MLSEFDVRFRTKLRESNLSCFTDCTKHRSASALTHQQQTICQIFIQQNCAASKDINLLSLIGP